jgi:hypothetical protein
VLWFRTHDITQTFLLGGDQIRDWGVALRPLSSLPLTGVPSLTGGTTIGPTYYWFLWSVARVIGPFCDYLPHAGGIGVAALQSVGDVALFIALWRRLQSVSTALLIVLTTATSGPDATLSATIWNPPVAAAFVKMALAALLWRRAQNWRTALAVVSASWLALQIHTTSLVVAAPAIAWLIIEPLVKRDWRVAGTRLALVASVVGLLQVPWLLQPTHHSSEEQIGIADSLAAVIAAPWESVRLTSSADLVFTSLEFLLLSRVTIQYFSVLLVTTGILIVLLTRDAALITASVGAVVTAIAVYSLWQGPLDHTYWLLVLAPSATIVMFGWIDRVHARAWIASVVLLLMLAGAQPARARIAWTFHGVPGYGAMVEGCRTIVGARQTVRDVRLTFDAPGETDALWLCSLIGVTVGTGPSPIAYIDEYGRVHYQ